jgi:hypothetical protein
MLACTLGAMPGCAVTVMGQAPSARPATQGVGDSARTPVSAGSDAGWYAGIASGWYFPIQRWRTPYVLGGGGNFFAGREFTEHVDAQLDVNMWLLSGTPRSTWDFKAAPSLVWTPGRGRILPFASAGIGVDVQTNYPSRTSAIGAMIPLGGGVRFGLGSKSSLFIAAQYYLLFRPVTTRDVPLLGGFRVGF